MSSACVALLNNTGVLSQTHRDFEAERALWAQKSDVDLQRGELSRIRSNVFGIVPPRGELRRKNSEPIRLLSSSYSCDN
jgi:hypothetical protein